MNLEITAFNEGQPKEYQELCILLANSLCEFLPEAENKIWHRHPVWFLDGNPTAGYSKLKAGIRLMFWSGADFEEEKLKPGTGKYKDASMMYTAADQVDLDDLKRWTEKARTIQWDYKNIYKRKGKLVRLE